MTWDTLNTSNTSNRSAMDINSTDDPFNVSDYNDTYNDSYFCEADEEQEQIIKTFQTCAFCLIFLLGIMGNCLVIATFALYRRLHMRSMTDIFLFHLALADLILLLTLPLQATDTHLGWIFSAPLCKAMRAFYAINTYSGLLLLACISVDRYMVVARAQEMLRLRSEILTAGMFAAVGVWAAAIFLSLPEIIHSGVSESDGKAFCVMKITGNVKMATDGTIIAIFCVSFFIMVICYTSIGVVLWGSHTHRRGKLWHHQRTLKLMVALVLVFLMFQLPYTLVLSRKLAGEFCGLLLEYITCTLAYTRCCLNPILYALVGVRFRKDVLQLMQDLGCLCGLQLRMQAVSSTSISTTSPGFTVLSACSPTSPDRSNSSSTFTQFNYPAVK